MTGMKTTETIVCPCCGQPVGEAKGLDFIRDVAAGPLQAKLLDALIRRKGRLVQMRVLADECFEDDPEGGPDDASNSIRVALMKLRQRLAPVGWKIESKGGRGPGSDGGAFYRLTPL